MTADPKLAKLRQRVVEARSEAEAASAALERETDALHEAVRVALEAGVAAAQLADDLKLSVRRIYAMRDQASGEEQENRRRRAREATKERQRLRAKLASIEAEQDDD